MQRKNKQIQYKGNAIFVIMVSQSEYYLNEILTIIINCDIKFMSGQINIDVKKNLYSMKFVMVIQNQR